MKKLAALLLFAVLCVVFSGCGTVYVNPYEDIPKPVAEITMDDGGVMRFVLDPAAAPNTVANFISLANSGFYDGLKIDYVYPTRYIRGGDPNGDGTGGPDYTIDGEFAENGFPLEGLKHKRGVISMCRLLDDPNSAGSQFFIMLSANFEYNGKYAAFGYIDETDTDSLAVLDAIASVPTDHSYRPLVRQTIATVRVKDTCGYVYEVVKSGEAEKQ